MSASMTAQLVAYALLIASGVAASRMTLMHHSHRGSQYASEQFQRLRADSGIACRARPTQMCSIISSGSNNGIRHHSTIGHTSRSCNVWDNAAKESFFSLKTARTARMTHRTWSFLTPAELPLSRKCNPHTSAPLRSSIA
jgi:putative transposase